MSADIDFIVGDRAGIAHAKKSRALTDKVNDYIKRGGPVTKVPMGASADNATLCDFVNKRRRSGKKGAFARHAGKKAKK